MGAIVLFVVGFFLIFIYLHVDFGVVKGYPLKAFFSRVGSLENGSEVRINGIKVGSVIDQTIDPVNFNAVIHMSIRNGINLPVDTVAMVSSDSLLGGKFIMLTPGRSKQIIPSNGIISNTKNFKSIEEMIGEVIFMTTNNQSSSSETLNK
jgi:phospholipid/cholesterol/gamma-HCH transport system substrate-binding protein